MKPAEGVFFRRDDYAPFWLRILVDVVDLGVFAVLCLALIAPLAASISDIDISVGAAMLACFAVAFLYFVVLKRSRVRTAGYRLGRVKVVDLKGELPSYPALTWRMLFGLLGPCSLIDLIWLTEDPHRQTLHDKFANTYVIKAAAQPAGSARIALHYYDIHGQYWFFREVDAAPQAGE